MEAKPMVYTYVKWMLISQSCPTFCDPMDCTLPGSSVHRILQARILEWVDIPFSRGSSWPRDWTWVSYIAGRFFTVWTIREAHGEKMKKKKNSEHIRRCLLFDLTVKPWMPHCVQCKLGLPRLWQSDGLCPSLLQQLSPLKLSLDAMPKGHENKLGIPTQLPTPVEEGCRH